MKRFLLTAAPVLLAATAPAAAQAPPDPADAEGWNSPRALALIDRAGDRRAAALADPELIDYQADARGYVYFYLDRTDTDERTLVKTDQVALDVFWRTPGHAKQRIIGLRDVRNLPTNIHYHEDHLAVVIDNFGDLIRIGDGDEVADVLHPAAPAGRRHYDYRLADSLTVRLPGTPEPLRVYRLDVRPRNPEAPGFVGSVYLDRRDGEIVRLHFTFTRASYVDRQLDYINVLLERALWRGRFWLPDRQQVEIRRQLPELGFPLGGVIRGTMRITNYRFNQNLPASVFAGRWLVTVPEAQRRAFAFEQPIDAELREAGLGPDTELADIRGHAAELMRGRFLSGLPATRLDLASSSGTVRYNRAEGLALGAGVRTRPDERTALAARGGWAFAARHPFASAEAERRAGAFRFRAEAYANRPGDVGVGPATAGTMNTLTALLAGYDFTDPFYAGGAAARVERRPGPLWTHSLTLRAERHRSAAFETDFSAFGEGSFRPVRPVDEGTLFGATLEAARSARAGVALGWSLAARADAGALEADAGTFRFVQPRADAEIVRRWSPGRAELVVGGAGGLSFGSVPTQALYLVGGRGTLPGHPFRGYGGDRFATARATAAADVAAPWARGRVFGAVGWTGAGADGAATAARWGAAQPVRPRASVGAGVGLLYDVVRLDFARGLGAGGRWELVVEANPTFWDFL